jgi:hypothetical protein
MISEQQSVSEEAPLETVEDVMNALAKPAEPEEGGESVQLEDVQPEVVESVDSLPIIDETVSPEATPSSTENGAAGVESTGSDVVPEGDTAPTETIVEPAEEVDSL